MQAISKFSVDIFGDKLPDYKEIKRLAAQVNGCEANKIAFEEQIKAFEQSNNNRLGLGVGLFILGKYKNAVEKLEKAKDTKEKFYYLARAYSKIKNTKKAFECFDKAKDEMEDETKTTLQKVEALTENDKCDEAMKMLKAVENQQKKNAEYHYQLARILDRQGEYQKAMENYRKALDIDQHHTKAIFHLAYDCDMRGNEEAAIDYYKQIKSGKPCYVNAMLNLAVLYEDRELFDKAAECVDAVIKVHPNHKKALLFKKDIDASKTMIYDEEKKMRLDKQHQILETPMSDFELSVRSRNCLRKMNITKLGDLLKITETELLAYKNFGETSLVEIKKILEMKNLHLGLALEDKLSFAESLPEEESEEVNDELLTKPISELELSVRARNCLTGLNMKTISEVIQRTEAELLGCKNFGVTSLNEIKQKLSGLGLSLRKIEE